ncbi:MAG: DUF3105 domain-containing protein [Candidatus Saccharimonadales bacterium]
MSNRFFIIIILALLVGLGGYIFSQNSKPKEAIIGTQHAEQSRDHIATGQTHEPFNSDPPSSGPHYAGSSAPAPWGVYVQEVPEEVFVHNQEHGGVIITYKPDLPKDQVEKLQKLFAPPYSNKSFKPTRAIVTPRPKNTKAIQLAAWTWTLSLDQYDEDKIMKFYLQRVGKGPEKGAGPFNAPINQAADQ